jgi:Flp pilus assembly protein TadG
MLDSSGPGPASSAVAGTWPRSPLRRTRSRRRRGQALVEFALVVPLFLLLLAAMIDFGLGLNASISVSNAAREGARLGAVDAISADIVSRVNSMMAPFPGVPTSVTATCTHAGGGTCTLDNAATKPGSGDSVIVTVSFNYRMIWPLAFGNVINLTSTAKFRIE